MPVPQRTINDLEPPDCSSYTLNSVNLTVLARIFFFQDGFMHKKVMLVDNRHSYVGTGNFHNRSFRLNFEITAAVSDLEFATEIEAMLLDDLSASIEAKRQYLESLSLWARLKAHGSASLAPAL